MAWYRTGTVAITNGALAVTGSGTNFIANVQAGDAILLPDGRIYEVAAITSATALTLASVYLGITASGQAYAIVPTRGLVQRLIQQIQTWNDAQQGYIDGPLAGRFGNGSASLPALAAAADVDTGMFFPAANTLAWATGGVERLRLSSSGLQANSGSGLSQVYSRANLLGTVSQASGVPTGAIIERGSNANGEYVRWADGTQICTISALATSGSTDTMWMFPAAFTYPADPGRPVVMGTVPTTVANGYRLLIGGLASGSSILVNAVNTSNARVATVVNLTAMGRWF